jgi:hypothetical protein
MFVNLEASELVVRCQAKKLEEHRLGVGSAYACEKTKSVYKEFSDAIEKHKKTCARNQDLVKFIRSEVWSCY